MKRLNYKVYNCIFKQNKMIILSDYEKIYLRIKLEIESHSIAVYFFVILSKYYESASNDLVDCFGRPVKSISTITNSPL